MKKICVMHRASIGDTLLATPVYRAIKENYPHVKTVVLTSRLGGELLQNNPYIDELIPYEKGDLIFPLLKKIWGADVAVILDHHYRNALYAFLAMISRRIGRGKDFINIHVDDPSPLTYEPWKYVNLLKPLGITTNDVTMTRPVATGEEQGRVANLCAELRSCNRKIVLIAPYSLESIKDWRAENYHKLILRIQEKGAAAVVIGGKEHFEKAATDFPTVYNFMGMTNLRETAELIAAADLLVCGCTSVLHICATTDTKAIAIYGPTSPLQWAPKKCCTAISHQISCSPCYKRSKEPCLDNKCIQEITVDEVWNVVVKEEFL